MRFGCKNNTLIVIIHLILWIRLSKIMALKVEARSCWELLPSENLLCCFSYLDTPRDLCNCAKVSKLWNQVAGDNVLWNKLYMREFNTNPSINISIMEQFSNKIFFIFNLKNRNYTTLPAPFLPVSEYKTFVPYGNKSELGNVTGITKTNEVNTWDIDENTSWNFSHPEIFGEPLSAVMIGASHIVTFVKDNIILIWDLQKNKYIYEATACSQGHYEYGKSYYWVVKVSPPEVHQIDLRQGNVFLTIPSSEDGVFSINTIKANHYLVLMNSGRMEVWEHNDQNCRLIAEKTIPHYELSSVAVNCNGIIFYNYLGKIFSWNFSENSSLSCDTNNRFLSVRFFLLANGDIFLRNFDGGMLVDGKRMEPIRHFNFQLEKGLSSIIPLDNRHLLTVDESGDIRNLDLETGALTCGGNVGHNVNLWLTPKRNIAIQNLDSGRYFCLRLKNLTR